MKRIITIFPFDKTKMGLTSLLMVSLKESLSELLERFEAGLLIKALVLILVGLEGVGLMSLLVKVDVCNRNVHLYKG